MLHKDLPFHYHSYHIPFGSIYNINGSLEIFPFLNSITLRKAKIVYNFGLSEYNRVNWASSFVVSGTGFGLQ